MRRGVGIWLIAALGLAAVHWAWAAEQAAPAPAPPPADRRVQNLTLQQCVEIALKQSPVLGAAGYNTVSARESLRRTYSSYLPQATFTTVHGRSGGVSFLETAAGVVPLSSANLRHDADLILSQTFWQTGRRLTLEQARANYHAAQHGEDSTLQQVIQNVAQAYYNALAQQSLVEVAKAALKAVQDQEQMVRARIEVGEAPQVDLAPAEAEVANAELQLIQAENNAGVAKAQLKNQMGVPPTFAIGLADRFSPGKAAAPSLSQALAIAYENRPDAKSSKASLQASLRSVQSAQARQGPVITVAGQYDEGLTRSLERIAWSFTAQAQVFLFDGGARKSDVQAAKANYRAAEQQNQQLLNNIGLEVETARLAVETAVKSIDAASKSVDRAQAQLAAAEGKYREGVGIYLEITNAQSTLTQAEINRVQAILSYHQALVNLQQALGTLAPATLPLPGGGK